MGSPPDGDRPVAQVLAELAATGRDHDGAALVRGIGEVGLLARCLTGDERQPLRLARFGELIDALARGAPRGPTLSCVVHLATFVPLVRRLAHPSLADVGRAAVAGRVVGTIAATDAGVAGSDLLGIETSISIEDDRIVLRGAKEWITIALFADDLAVVARHRPGRHFSSLSLVLVPADAPGVTREEVDSTVMAGAGIGRVGFDDVVLAPTALLGRPGRGLAYFVEQMAAERLAGGFWAVAVARQALDRTVRHLRGRRVGEGALWERSAVRHDLARMAVRLRMLEALVAQIVATGSTTGRLPAGDTAVLKAALAPVAIDTVERCLQLHGAEGFADDHGLLRLLDDVRIFGVAGGSTETMLDLVADDLVAAGPAGREWPPSGASAGETAGPLAVRECGQDLEDHPVGVVDGDVGVVVGRADLDHIQRHQRRL
jgi:citronellyl-CoA dehydrogenase